MAYRRINQLESQLAAMVPRKRQRVDPDPNITFVGLREIQRAQTRAETVQTNVEESPEVPDSSDIGDCIVAAV